MPLECERVGEHLAFDLGDWKHGLPYLIRGSNEKLMSLAWKDHASPQEPDKQVDIADGWKSWANGISDAKRKTTIHRHATDWYLRAERHLVGKEREAVTQQLREMNEVTDLLQDLNPATAEKNGDWKLEDKSLISPASAWAWVSTVEPPHAEYLATIEVEGSNKTEPSEAGQNALLLGLNFKGKPFVLAVDWETQGQGHVAGFVAMDRTYSWSPLTAHCHFSEAVLKPKQKNRIDVSVDAQGIALFVNGQELLDYKGEYDRLGLGAELSGAPTNKVFLGSHLGSYRFSKFEVRRLPTSID